MLRPKNTWRSWIGLYGGGGGDLVGDHDLEVSGHEIIHAAVQDDATAVDEGEIGEMCWTSSPDGS